MTDAIKLAIEALEIAKRDSPTIQDTLRYERAIAALRAQPKSFSDELREVAKRGKPDHSELIARLHGITSESWGQVMVIADKAANALEGL